MVAAKNIIDKTKNAGKSATILMAMPPGWYGAMRIAQWNAFVASWESQYMPPSGECLRHIAPVATIVNEFVETTQNTNKNKF